MSLAPDTMVVFSNRDGSGIARVVAAETGDWPTVERADGERTALNPALNEIRLAEPEEINEFVAECQRRERAGDE